MFVAYLDPVSEVAGIEHRGATSDSLTRWISIELIVFTAGCVVFLGSATVSLLKRRYDLLAFLIGASVLNFILGAVGDAST